MMRTFSDDKHGAEVRSLQSQERPSLVNNHLEPGQGEQGCQQRYDPTRCASPKSGHFSETEDVLHILRSPTPFLHPPHLSLAHTPDLEKAVICGPKLQIHTFNSSLTPPTCRSNRSLTLLKPLLLPDPSPRYLTQTV